MNLQRFVNIGYAIIGIVTWVIAAGLFGWAFELISADLDRPLIGTEFARSDLLGLVCGVAVGVALKMNRAVNTWALEVANELRRVSWPSWEETRLSTIVVVVTSVVVAVLLGILDLFWGIISEWVYTTFG